MPELTIAGRKIGPGQPTYIIAEIGVNHNGDPRFARRLVDVCAEAQVDAVKFQKRALKALYPESVLADLTAAEKELQYFIPMLEEFELSEYDMGALAEYTTSLGLQFLCTPWDIPSVHFLASLGVPAFKVASADLTNLFLLEALADIGKPLLISTGMSRWEEIETSVAFLKCRGVEFALLHCQSTYPAPFSSVHLSFMERLKEFGVPVGYSGHERGIAISTAAVAMGACILERHITLDRTMRGPDHAASLEPAGLDKQVRDIRNLEEAFGDPRRPLSRGELLNRHALAKSLVAARDIPAGEIITRADLAAMGPGTGISAQRCGELVGRALRRAVAKGEQFRESDLLDVAPAEIAAAFPLRWGPVVRYRDAAALSAWEPDVLEFHFTDQDLDADLPELGPFTQELVIHAPEYYHSRLLDLCSPEEPVRDFSLDIIRRVCERAREMCRFFPAQRSPVKLVVHAGGMSYDGFVTDTSAMYAHLETCAEILYQEGGVEVLLENLPPLPWYFGGQWYGDVFVDPEEIARFCADHKAGITFDLSHAQLACNHRRTDILDFIRLVRPYIRHLHISDTIGTDGEGLQIGEGDTDLPTALAELRHVNAAWIPEVWLGHRNDGEGFLVGLARIKAALDQTDSD